MSEETTETASNHIIIDLGKQRARRVKRLRKGRGKLMDDVNVAIAELQESEAIPAGAQVVVVVVQRKARRAKIGGPLPFFRR